MATYLLTQGDDVRTGTSGDDTFDGRSYRSGGTDTLRGEGGNDTFMVSPDFGTVDGGSGIDTLVGGRFGNATYSNIEVLDAFNDIIFCSIEQINSFSKIINTGTANDAISINLRGVGGTINLFSVIDSVSGAFVRPQNPTSGYSITGSKYGDTIYGTPFDDSLLGGDGNDKLYSSSFEGGGVDVVNGGNGDDVLEIGRGRGKFLGGAGDDTFIVGGASGTVDGGTGIDTVRSDNLGTAIYRNIEYLETDSIRATIRQLGEFGSLKNLNSDESYFALRLVGEGGTLDFSSFSSSKYGITVNTEELTSGLKINGSKYNDNVYGTQFADVIMGGSGNDNINCTLYWSGDVDYVDGGLGNDTIEIDNSSGSFLGGAGDDLFVAYGVAGIVDGGVGYDTLKANNLGAAIYKNFECLDSNGIRASIQQLRAFDRIENSSVFSGFTEIHLIGLGGSIDFSSSISNLRGIFIHSGELTSGYQVVATKGEDFLNGTAFSDTLNGGDGNDMISGGGGNDVLSGGLGVDNLDGGSGTDTVSYARAIAGVKANLADPSVNAGEAKGDRFSSVENLAGSAFNDTLEGDDGANAISGFDGNDLIRGATGSDILKGGAGNDTLGGGDGNDLLSGGDGADYLSGGLGLDTASYASAAGGVSVNLTDKLSSAGEAAGDTFNSVENVEGSGFGDKITGNAAANIIKGLSGADLINGGAGSDTLSGGVGTDVFVFSAALGVANADTITDFTAVDDTIRLENAVFGALAGTGTLSASYFRTNVSGRAQDANDFIIYESDTGKLFYDADGNGATSAIHFATLAGNPSIGATDFVVI